LIGTFYQNALAKNNKARDEMLKLMLFFSDDGHHRSNINRVMQTLSMLAVHNLCKNDNAIQYKSNPDIFAAKLRCAKFNVVCVSSTLR